MTAVSFSLKTCLVSLCFVTVSACGGGTDVAGTETEISDTEVSGTPMEAVTLEVQDPLADASLTELADVSSDVLIGRVTASEESVTEGPLVYEDLSVEVIRTIRGSVRNGEIIVIRQLVGQADGRRVDVVGAADVTRGASVWMLSALPGEGTPTIYAPVGLGAIVPGRSGDVAVGRGINTAALREARTLGTIEAVARRLDIARGGSGR